MDQVGAKPEEGLLAVIDLVRAKTEEGLLAVIIWLEPS